MGRIVDLLQMISTGAGILSLGITLIVAYFAARNGILKSANDAQTSALGAMSLELQTLRERIEDAEKENARLDQIIDTICAALKRRGLIISVQGEMIHIQDANGTTSQRIRKP
jgi:hypothetical protein